jgi:uncharacterized membrane protein YuzA (DUF378 family)
MQTSFFELLHQQGLLSDESLDKIRQKQNDGTISLFWDLRIVLYAGVLLITGGLGVLIYKNIDDIGHLAVILAMTAISLICYLFALRKMNPFSWQEVRSPGIIFDYTLLLGSILMITLVGYVQYQYKVFGTEWKLATFIPMVILFVTAYFFDNQALLSMAIVNLAAWLGVTINEKIFLATEQINNKTTLITACLLGVGLILASIASRLSLRKAHFDKLYHLFGTHMYFISAFIALFVFQPDYYAWVLVFIAGAVYHFIKAVRENSYYYMVITLVYLYGCFGFIAVDMLDKIFGDHQSIKAKMTFAYFTVSAIALIYLLIRQNKKIRKHAGL